MSIIYIYMGGKGDRRDAFADRRTHWERSPGKDLLRYTVRTVTGAEWSTCRGGTIYDIHDMSGGDTDTRRET